MKMNYAEVFVAVYSISFDHTVLELVHNIFL
jgi:hypothetical protein